MLSSFRIPALVMALAAAAPGLHAAKVCNAGFPGENSARILQRLPQALAACPRPAFVVVFVGMNDAVNDQQFRTPEQTFADVSQMLDDIHASGAQGIVVTVHMPDQIRLLQRHSLASYGGRDPAQRIDETNTALRKAATSVGATLVDFNAVLAKAGGANETLSTDGVHLTAEGYGLLAMTIASALPKSSSTATVLCLGDSLTYGIGVRPANAPDAGSASYPQQLERLLNSEH